MSSTINGYGVLLNTSTADTHVDELLRAIDTGSQSLQEMAIIAFRICALLMNGADLSHHEVCIPRICNFAGVLVRHARTRGFNTPVGIRIQKVMQAIIDHYPQDLVRSSVRGALQRMSHEDEIAPL